MWLVEVSTVSGWRAAGRKRWQWFTAQRCEPPFITLRPMRTCGWAGSKLSFSLPPRGLRTAQQDWPGFFFGAAACSLHQSEVYSQTLPIMS